MQTLVRASGVDGVDVQDRRAYVRWALHGAVVRCRIGKHEFEIRLKDLSRGGAGGLVDEPFAVGDHFFMVLRHDRVVDAEVRWSHGASVGVRFTNIVTARFVTSLHAAAAKDAETRRTREAQRTQG